MYLYSCIFLSARAVEWESSCFATSVSPCTAKGDISGSAIYHLWKFILIDWYIAGLHKLYFATSVVFPVALISIYCVLFTDNVSKVVDWGHELTLLLSFFSFRST